MLKKTLLLVLPLAVLFGGMLLASRSSIFEVRDSLSIDQSPEALWAVLFAVQDWPQWWPGVESAKLAASWVEGERLDLVFKGNPTAGPARIERYRIGRELAFSREGVLGSRVGTGIQLEPQGTAVLVSAESVVRGPQALLARVTGREAFSAYQQRLLVALKERVSQGERSAPPVGVLDER